jgi:hypothetical protein
VSSPSDFPEKVWLAKYRSDGGVSCVWTEDPRADDERLVSEYRPYFSASLVAELLEAAERFLQQAAPDVRSEVALSPEQFDRTVRAITARRSQLRRKDRLKASPTAEDGVSKNRPQQKGGS